MKMKPKMIKLNMMKIKLSPQMSRMLIVVGIIFGLIFGFKLIGGYIGMKKFLSRPAPTVTVSAMEVQYQDWQPHIKASGSLSAVQGVDVTTEIAGMVRTILLVPGTEVKAGDILVELNADAEIAQLHSLQAVATLAKITYMRDKEQFAAQAVSKSTVDTGEADLNNAEAQVAGQEAILAKKTIRAPFAGRIGIKNINVGQYLNPGDKIASLQALDPVHVDFYIPQKMLVKLVNEQVVSIGVDAYPNTSFEGKITTINPVVNAATRNVRVQATIPNPDKQLLPGMFVSVDLKISEPQKYLTVPQTAITFNSFGDMVYLVKSSEKDKTKKENLIASQVFVKVGETRGDQVAILEGLQEGDRVITSGQLKIKNGTKIIINNVVVPADNPHPVLKDE